MDNSDAQIIIIDDEKNSRDLLDTMLKADNYRTQCVASGELAFEWLKTHKPDLVLLDVMLGGINGYEVAKKLKSNFETKSIPIIMLTSLTDRESRLKGLKSGVEEFITKPVDRVELCARVKTMLRIKGYNDLLNQNNLILEEEVRSRTKELHDSYIETIFTLTKAAEYKDKDTGAHVRRISYFCRFLALNMKLDSVFIDSIFYASPMHDLGKIGISDQILLKPDKHTKEEFEIMKSHSRLGFEILETAMSPYLTMGAEIALHHHEKWDGSGYPNGLNGNKIPVSARIMAVCDVYDALRSQRPYKAAYDHSNAVEIILKGDGRTLPQHFDPEILKVFQENEDYFQVVYNKMTE